LVSLSPQTPISLAGEPPSASRCAFLGSDPAAVLIAAAACLVNNPA
jgi:hypothetical protein